MQLQQCVYLLVKSFYIFVQEINKSSHGVDFFYVKIV